MKLKEKTEAILLRQAGHSLKEISSKLHISKSTASLWLKNIEINAEARIKINSAYQKGTLLGLAAIQKRWKIVQTRKQEKAKKVADIVLNSIHVDSHLAKLLCALLFWCEGGKQEEQILVFINSDPMLVATFLALLRKGFTINEKKFKVMLHLHEYHKESKQKQFWAKVTGIPISQFYKSYLKPHTQKRIREGYQGCVSIRYTDNAQTITTLKTIYKNFPELIKTK